MRLSRAWLRFLKVLVHGRFGVLGLRAVAVAVVVNDPEGDGPAGIRNLVGNDLPVDRVVGRRPGLVGVRHVHGHVGLLRHVDGVVDVSCKVQVGNSIDFFGPKKWPESQICYKLTGVAVRSVQRF